MENGGRGQGWDEENPQEININPRIHLISQMLPITPNASHSYPLIEYLKIARLKDKPSIILYDVSM